jgi:hypothetical protein
MAPAVMMSRSQQLKGGEGERVGVGVAGGRTRLPPPLSPLSYLNAAWSDSSQTSSQTRMPKKRA